MQVRALKECFVADSIRAVGDVFDAPEGTKLFSKGKKNDPVLELMDQPKKAPPPKRSRSVATDEPDEGA